MLFRIEFNNKEEHIEKKIEQNLASSVNAVKAGNYAYSNATNIKQNNSVGTLNDIDKQDEIYKTFTGIPQ